MNTTKLFFLAFVALGFYACEDKVDLDLPEGEPQLVVDGMFSDDDSSTIVLSMSTPYFNDGATPRVSSADVMITSNTGDTITLTEDLTTPGNYTTRERGQIGKSYTLHITLPNGEQYTSLEEKMNRVPPIDSIYYLDKDEVDEPFLEDGFVVLIDTQEPLGKGDFYRWTYELNGKLHTDPEDLFYAEDELVDGNYITENALVYELKLGDHVVIRQLSITERAFNFFWLLEQQVEVGGPFDAPPAPIKSNVLNNDKNKADALGLFQVSGVAKASITIQ